MKITDIALIILIMMLSSVFLCLLFKAMFIAIAVGIFTFCFALFIAI